MASNDLKLLVAREIASGESVADVARRHKYSWRGMKQLSERPEVRRLVGQERERLVDLAEAHRAGLVVLGGRALDGIARVIADRQNPHHVATCRWLVDKLLPQATQRHEHEHDHRVAHEASPEVEEAIVSIAKTLASIGHHDPEAILKRSVREGPDALPSPAAGVELLPAASQVLSRDGNGSPKRR